MALLIMSKLLKSQTRDELDIAGSVSPPEKQQHLKKEEFGGPKGQEPTRYGDWEKNGRCIDF